MAFENSRSAHCSHITCRTEDPPWSMFTSGLLSWTPYAMTTYADVYPNSDRLILCLIVSFQNEGQELREIQELESSWINHSKKIGDLGQILFIFLMCWFSRVDPAGCLEVGTTGFCMPSREDRMQGRYYGSSAAAKRLNRANWKLTHLSREIQPKSSCAPCIADCSHSLDRDTSIDIHDVSGGAYICSVGSISGSTFDQDYPMFCILDRDQLISRNETLAISMPKLITCLISIIRRQICLSRCSSAPARLSYELGSA